MVDPFLKEISGKDRAKLVLRNIFIKRMPMNLLSLIIIIGAVALSVFLMGPEDSPTGGSVIEIPVETECPECICEQTECTQDCSLCPVKTKVEFEEVIKYECFDGSVVDDLRDCEREWPEVPDDGSGSVSGITLFVEDIELEEDEGDSGFVIGIDYVIVNKGEFPVVPKMQVKVYDDWTLKVKKNPPNKILDPEIVVMPNTFRRVKESTRIWFDGEDQTLRLLMVDTLPDPDDEVLAVTKEFSLN